jgi:hypothetical protein
MQRLFKAVLFLNFALLLPQMSSAQSPIEVVQAQLDAYNAHDIDAFAALFAEKAEVYMNLGDTVPAMLGREAVHKSYGAMFATNPNNKSTLLGRMVQGNFVFDHELITGRSGPLQLMAIYEVEQGMIVRCWFAR